MRGTPQLKNDILDLTLIIPPHSIGVEIGCFQGESTELFLDSGKFQRLHCVDPWQDGYYKKHKMSEVEEAFDKRIAGFPDIVCKYKTTGVEFLAAETDPYINFIYIDGDHNYESVKQDIIHALEVLNNSKSNKTKILAGHDYKHPGIPGVEKAVKELLGYPDIRFAGHSWAKIINR